MFAVASTHEDLVRDRIALLQALDLDNVRRKLMVPSPEGKGWAADCTIAAEKWYKRFLILRLKYPGVKIVPNAMIDDFWHHHILDTKAYARDCENVLGFFLHHDPYYGMNGDADARDESFDVTNELFRREFGEDPLSLGDKALECTSDCGVYK